MKKMWKFYGNILVISITLFKECFGEYSYFDQLVVYDAAKVNCSSRNMIVAKIETHEKWIEMFNLLTNGGRKFPSQDVYIGLIYDQSQGVHKWADGTAADWTKWYTNEPYNVQTRHCVRLGVDVDLHFRTTDCTYQHHYLCSIDDSVNEESADKPVVNQPASDNQEDMVIGLSAGFGAFGGVVAACCVLCWCCCSKEPTKPLKYTTMRSRNPKMPTYQRHSPGGNSYDTFVTSHSSRMDDFDMGSHGSGVHKIEIDYEDQKINYSKNDDYSLKIHCPNDDTVSMNDSSVSSKKSPDFGGGRQPRSHDFLHYM